MLMRDGKNGMENWIPDLIRRSKNRGGSSLFTLYGGTGQRSHVQSYDCRAKRIYKYYEIIYTNMDIG